MKWVDLICVFIVGLFLVCVVNFFLIIFALYDDNKAEKWMKSNSNLGLEMFRRWEKKYGPLEWD